MKDDVPPLPAFVPRKRHQIQHLADVHIAMWLGGDAITDAERDLLQREKDRRKGARRSVALAIMEPTEGMTPLQRKAVREWRDALEPCTLVDFKDATHLIVLPRSTRIAPDMADTLKLARRRNISVRVVLPDGREA